MSGFRKYMEFTKYYFMDYSILYQKLIYELIGVFSIEAAEGGRGQRSILLKMLHLSQTVLDDQYSQFLLLS